MESLKKKWRSLPLRRFFILTVSAVLLAVALLSGLVIWGCSSFRHYLLPDANAVYLTVEEIWADGSASTGVYLLEYGEKPEMLPVLTVEADGIPVQRDVESINYSIQKMENSLSALSPKRKLAYQVCGITMVAAPTVFAFTGILLCILYFYRQKLKQPISLLSDATDRIAKQDLDFELTYDCGDEMGDLCRSFEEMRKVLYENNKEMWSMLEERRLMQASVAHDLRNPIAIIEGYAEYLENGLKNGEMSREKTRHIAQNLGMAAKRLEGYTESVRLLNCTEETELNRKNISAAKLADDIAEDLKLLSEKSGISLKVGAGLPDREIQADAVLLYRVLENIMGNALRYAKKEICLDFALLADTLSVTVTDDGKGFPDEVLRKKEKTLLMHRADGHMGIGLAISRLLCKKHGGSLELSNGAGTELRDGNSPASDSGASGGSADAGSGWQGDGLKFLCNPYSDSACYTENGYYYQTFDTVELADGTYGSHLMYMDYASCREIYLCSTAGCRHDSPDCPAVLPYDDFPVSSTKLFVSGDHLYILSREYDDDGAMSQDYLLDGTYDEPAESQPAVLYQAKLDGTERKKIYTFDPALTLEDFVIGDGSGIYVIAKKLSTDQEGGVTFTASSDRRLMYLDLDSVKIAEVCPMTFDDGIFWNVIGCSEGSLILSGTDYGREISRDEMWDDDAYREIYENSSDVYAVLELGSGALREFYRIPNRDVSSEYFIGDTLYVSTPESRSIEGINVKTGEKSTLCEFSETQIMDAIGDVLCCRDWDLAGDQTWYFVDTKTGEVSHCALVNQNNGWSLEFKAVTASDVLVVYDYDAEGHSDGSYEIFRYKYALISKEDLFAGNGNYRKIEMIGAGV